MNFKYFILSKELLFLKAFCCLNNLYFLNTGADWLNKDGGSSARLKHKKIFNHRKIKFSVQPVATLVAAE